MMDKKTLDNNFKFHPPHGDQAARYEKLRAMGKMFAEKVEYLCPDSREKSLAMTKIEESVMWANAAIARNEVEEAGE